MREPVIRGHIVQLVIDHLATHQDRRLRAVVDAIPEELRETVRDAGRLGWVPAKVIVDVDQIVFDQLGRLRTVEFWREFSFAQTELPLFRPVVDGVRRIFGVSPVVMMIKAATKTWTLAQRDCATLRVVDHAPQRRLDLRYEDLAPVCRTEPYAIAAAGMPETALHLCGVRYSIRVDSSGLADGLIVVEARWRLGEGGAERA